MKIFKYIIVILMPVLAGCSKGPKPIDYGKEECVFCKMTIIDKHFGCQVLNTKTKAFNFDDLSCMIGYLLTGAIGDKEIAAIYVPDYSGKNQLMPAEGMFYVSGEMLHSPMSGNTAAFSNKDSALVYVEKLQGKLFQWQEIWKKND